MKHSIVVAMAMAFATPLVSAEAMKADPAAAAKSHSMHSTSDRQVAKQLVATGSGAATLGAVDRSEIRDWARIDKDKDHLISPEEMQAYLQESWAARKK
jgi:hypothetical protein